jgi:hypothetical protein
MMTKDTEEAFIFGSKYINLGLGGIYIIYIKIHKKGYSLNVYIILFYHCNE